MQQNLDSQLNQIREVGYCVIEAALQADVINAVKHALLPWFGRQRMGRNNFEGIILFAEYWSVLVVKEYN